MENSFGLPQNKPLVNGKYKTIDAITTAITNLFTKEGIEGTYADKNWVGVQKLQNLLHNNSIKFEQLDVAYEGHGEVEGSSLPTKKVYRIRLDVRDKEGKNIPLYLKVTCQFSGKTGTMADKEYQLTYKFF